MSFRRTGGLNTGVFSRSAAGAVLKVPSVLDFTQSKPSVVCPTPTAVPGTASAVLRYRVRERRTDGTKCSEFIPVDPLYLAFHLEFSDSGCVIRVSSMLVAFLCRVAAANLGRGGRLSVGGCPALETRSVTRGTQLNFEPRVIFSAGPDAKCQVRGCRGKRVAGVFCADHYDSTFSHGMMRRQIQTSSRASVMLSHGVRSELNVLFSGFDSFWIQVGTWLSAGSHALSADRVRTLVVNHASDHVQKLATTTLSPDRIGGLMFVTHRLSQGSQCFYNALMAVRYTRTQQERTGVLASRVAASIGRFRMHAAPVSDPTSRLFTDAGIVTFKRMPVLPVVEAWVGRADGGLLAATVIPGPDEAPTAVVFSVFSLRILSRIFARIGDFSFAVRTGSMRPLPRDAIVLDAAAPLNLRPYMRLSGIERAERDLHVVNPAALSSTVLGAIIFYLRFRHVVFHGPRLGEYGIAYPVFENIGLDPWVGFYWSCILDESAVRGTLRQDTGGDPLWRHEGRGFLDIFVDRKTPVRCTNAKCPHCGPTTSWHLDHLMAEACFGSDGIASLPPCALRGLCPFQTGETKAAIEFWRTLCEPTLEVHAYF